MVMLSSEILINIFLTHGANIEYFGSDEITAFHSTCKYGGLEIAQLLIEHTARVKNCDYYGQTGFDGFDT